MNDLTIMRCRVSEEWHWPGLDSEDSGFKALDDDVEMSIETAVFHKLLS